MRILKSAVSFVLLFSCLFLGGTQSALSLKGTKEEKIPYDFDLSSYISLGDLDQLTAEYQDPTLCTQEEIDEAVFRILLQNATFTESDVVAQRYYKVKIDFSIEKEGEILSEYSQADYELIIGFSEENEVEELLGQALIGATAGEEKRLNYTYPASLLGSPLAGEEVTLCALVKAVSYYELPVLTDESVKELFSDEFETVEEFYRSVKEDILKEKELQCAQAVWLALCEQVRVKDYPEEELSDYVALYKKNYEEMAEKYGLTLSQLVEEYLYMDMDTFYTKGEEAAREKVKNDMIFLQLVRTFDVTLTEKEYAQGAKAYFEEEAGDFGSFEEFEEYYTKENLEQNILFDKALKILVEKTKAK